VRRQRQTTLRPGGRSGDVLAGSEVSGVGSIRCRQVRSAIPGLAVEDHAARLLFGILPQVRFGNIRRPLEWVSAIADGTQ